MSGDEMTLLAETQKKKKKKKILRNRLATLERLESQSP